MRDIAGDIYKSVVVGKESHGRFLLDKDVVE